MTRSNFNFIKAQLKLHTEYFLIKQRTDFNSIKVQLKPAQIVKERLLSQFQFHKGTIKTIANFRVRILFAKFQFHKGTIKTRIIIINRMIVLHFNSIKVQLKPAPVLLSDITPLFQFHKGTIKTAYQQPQQPPVNKFQFHKGTIKTGRASDRSSCASISIP